MSDSPSSAISDAVSFHTASTSGAPSSPLLSPSFSARPSQWLGPEPGSSHAMPSPEVLLLPMLANPLGADRIADQAAATAGVRRASGASTGSSSCDCGGGTSASSCRQRAGAGAASQQNDNASSPSADSPPAALPAVVEPVYQPSTFLQNPASGSHPQLPRQRGSSPQPPRSTLAASFRNVNLSAPLTIRTPSYRSSLGPDLVSPTDTGGGPALLPTRAEHMHDPAYAAAMMTPVPPSSSSSSTGRPAGLDLKRSLFGGPRVTSLLITLTFLSSFLQSFVSH